MNKRAIPLSWAVCVAVAVATWPAWRGDGLVRAQAPQAPAPRPAEPPKAAVFKSGVELISVDVSVVDKSGNPVRSLRPDQFEVSIDGRSRRVVSADLVDHAPEGGAAAPVAAAAKAAAAPLRPAYSTNESGSAPISTGRLIFLAIDQSSFRPAGARGAIEAARRFAGRLQPNDRLGLVTFPPPGPSVAASRNRASVLDRLQGITGWGDGTRTTGLKNVGLSEAFDIRDEDEMVFQLVVARECQGASGADMEMCAQQVKGEAVNMAAAADMQAARTLQALNSLVDGLARIPERKTVVIISGGLPMSARAGGRGMTSASDVTTVASRASAANTNIYVLHVDRTFLDAFSAAADKPAPSLTQDATLLEAGLATIAGGSGGTLFKVVSQADFAFDRVLRETSASYILGVEPAETDRDGKSHGIRVNVNAPGVQVRSRREFLFPRKTAADTPEDALMAALHAPRTATTLALGVSTHAIGPEGTNVRVLITARVGSGLTAPVQARSALLLSDTSGRVLVDSAAAKRTLPLSTAGDGSASYLSTVAVPPGDYILRLVVADDSGRTGSVDHPFSIALPSSDGVTLGDLLLIDPAVPATEGLAPIPDGRVRGNRVEAHLEFVPRAGSTPQVTFGVAERPDGDLLVQAKGLVSKTRSEGRAAAGARLDVSLLPPGDYVAVAVLTDGGKRLPRRYEPVRIERAAVSAPAPAVGGSPDASATPRVRFVLGDSARLVKAFSRADVLVPSALSFFLTRLQDADSNPAPGVPAALAAVRAGQFDAALASLGDAAPATLSVAFLKGLALLSRNELEPAAAQFRLALKAADDFLPAAFYLGACYAAGGRDLEAVGAWRTALVTETDARIVYDVLADALLRLEQADDAVDLIEEAQGRWSDDATYLPRLAVAEAMRNHRARALETLRTYLETHRADAEAAALAIRLIYEVHASGGTLVSAEADRELAGQYAGWYRAAAGTNQALVDRWVAFIRGK